MTYFLTEGLFRCVLFNSQTFGGFSKYLLSLTCSLIPLWSENIFGMISGILNLLNYVTQSIVFHEETPYVLERKLVFCWLESSINVNWVKLVASVVQVFFYSR